MFYVYGLRPPPPSAPVTGTPNRRGSSEEDFSREACDEVSDPVSLRGKTSLRLIGNAQLIITTLCGIPSIDVVDKPASQGIDEWHYLTHTFDRSRKTITIPGISRAETGDILVHSESMCTPSDEESDGGTPCVEVLLEESSFLCSRLDDIIDVPEELVDKAVKLALGQRMEAASATHPRARAALIKSNMHCGRAVRLMKDPFYSLPPAPESEMNNPREKLKMIRIHGRDSHDLDFKIFLAISDDKDRFELTRFLVGCSSKELSNAEDVIDASGGGKTQGITPVESDMGHVVQQVLKRQNSGRIVKPQHECLPLDKETHTETVREAGLEKSGGTEAYAQLQSQNTASRGWAPPHASSPPPHASSPPPLVSSATLPPPLATSATSPASSLSPPRSSGDADECRQTLSETETPHSRPDANQVEDDSNMVLGRRFSSFGIPEFSIANKFLGVSDFEFNSVGGASSPAYRQTDKDRADATSISNSHRPSNNHLPHLPSSSVSPKNELEFAKETSGDAHHFDDKTSYKTSAMRSASRGVVHAEASVHAEPSPASTSTTQLPLPPSSSEHVPKDPSKEAGWFVGSTTRVLLPPCSPKHVPNDTLKEAGWCAGSTGAAAACHSAGVEAHRGQATLQSQAVTDAVSSASAPDKSKCMMQEPAIAQLQCGSVLHATVEQDAAGVRHLCVKETANSRVLLRTRLLADSPTEGQTVRLEPHKGSVSNGVEEVKTKEEDKTKDDKMKDDSEPDGVVHSLSLIEQHLKTLEQRVQQTLDTVSSNGKLSDIRCPSACEEVDKGKLGGGVTERKECLSSPPPTTDNISHNFGGVVAAGNAGRAVLTSGSSALPTASVSNGPGGMRDDANHLPSAQMQARTLFKIMSSIVKNECTQEEEEGAVRFSGRTPLFSSVRN